MGQAFNQTDGSPRVNPSSQQYSFNAGTNSLPAVVGEQASGLNHFLVVWQRDYSSTDQDILAQLVSDDGTPQIPEFVIENDTQPEKSPAVALIPDQDRWLVTRERLDLTTALDAISSRASREGQRDDAVQHGGGSEPDEGVHWAIYDCRGPSVKWQPRSRCTTARSVRYLVAWRPSHGLLFGPSASSPFFPPRLQCVAFVFGSFTRCYRSLLDLRRKSDRHRWAQQIM